MVCTYVLQIIDDRTVCDICVNTSWKQLHQILSEEAKEKLKEVKEELNGRIS